MTPSLLHVNKVVFVAAYPMLNAGGCEKLNPPTAAPDWGAMEELAGGAGEAAAPAPNVNTPGVELFVDPNALAPPNWKPPPDRKASTSTPVACCRAHNDTTSFL